MIQFDPLNGTPLSKPEESKAVHPPPEPSRPSAGTHASTVADIIVRKRAKISTVAIPVLTI
jgi:hypothetical protein